MQRPVSSHSIDLRKMAQCLVSAVGLAIVSIIAMASEHPVTPTDDDPQRTERATAFRIIDNVYFVGARLHLPSYLITTPQGHILIDTSYDEYVPEIVDNIASLGFRVEDIKLLLSSHAHHDHVGGHATMREISGAITLASAADKDVIESGGKTDFRDRGTWTPATVDRVIVDGEKVRLGDVTLTAHFTPGHTKGCTTWTTIVSDGDTEYDLAILGGVRVNSNEPLVNHPDYPNMPQDFAYTFARLKVLPVDVYLGAHGYWFDLAAKRERLRGGAETNPFIDPQGYRRAIEFWETEYLNRLEEETHGHAE